MLKSLKIQIRSFVFSIQKSFRYVPKQTLIIIVLYIVSGVLPYGSSYVLGKLVDAIVAGVNNVARLNIFYLILIYALASGLPTIVNNFRKLIERNWHLRFSDKLDIFLLKIRESIDIAHMESPDFQDLMQRALRNGNWPILEVVRTSLFIIWYLSSFVLGTIISVNFDPMIYLVVIVSAAPGFIVDMKFAGRDWNIWTKDSPEQRRYSDLREHIDQKNYLIETKLFQSGNKFISLMNDILNNFSNKLLRQERSKFTLATITDAISLCGFAIGLYLVVQKALVGEVLVGGVVFMLSALTSVRSSINYILVYVSNQYRQSLTVNDIVEVVETLPHIIESEDPIPLKLKSAPEIVFENVSFKYQNSDKWSLRNLNITFKAGDNIGLVGNNGAGKTTLVKLLCRIYEPTEGRILINGVDLRDVSTKEWWSYLAVMFQDYATYDFLVKDAIAISKPNKELNLTKVIEAGKVSQAHDFIMEWKDKYDEQLGVEFKGKEPSKGQRQKLSIAKILYRDSFVMVLDEPTASVDAESEAKIFDSIENLPKDRTAILISHDFSTISQCDKIFVLDKGKLIEEGSHKELMKNKGLYSELYNLQAERFRK